jgi:hypothetical protein
MIAARQIRATDFEQISQATVANEAINQIKANCANNDDNQYVYEHHKHRLSPDFGLPPISRPGACLGSGRRLVD